MTEEFLKQINIDNDSEAKLFLNRIKDLAEQSLKKQQPEWTNFLTPAQREQAQAVLNWVTGSRYNSLGGYSQAERRRIVVYPDYYLVETIEPALAFLEIKANAPGELTHRDFLGSLLALGIKREKLGDLLVTENTCQLILVPELVDFVKMELEKVANAKVEINLIEPEQLNLPNLREKVIRATVASLRLDAVAALGFGDSRTKMAREIKSDKVKVNWKPTRNPDQLVTVGDIISIRGRGRVILRELTGVSKKGRQGISLVRLL